MRRLRKGRVKEKVFWDFSAGEVIGHPEVEFNEDTGWWESRGHTTSNPSLLFECESLAVFPGYSTLKLFEGF